MYTRCPECNTLFQISAKHLAVAQGTVRCGQCLHVFQALDHLFDDSSQTKAAGSTPRQPSFAPGTGRESAPDEARAADIETITDTLLPEDEPYQPAHDAPDTPYEHPPTTAQDSAADATPPHGDYVAIPVYRAIGPPEAVAFEMDHDSETEEITDQDYLTGMDAAISNFESTDSTLPPAASDSAPSAPVADPSEAVADQPSTTTKKQATTAEAPEISAKEIIIEDIKRRSKKRKKRGLFSTLLWSMIIIAMLLLLLGQYVYFLRADLARYPELRPWLEKLCRVAKCEIPLQRDLSAIQISDRDVRTHPEIPGALLVNAILVNQADFAQPFPVVEITLSSMEHSKVSSRRFKPNEYLDRKVDIAKGMPPGQSVLMRLELTDPGKDVVNFEFEFF